MDSIAANVEGKASEQPADYQDNYNDINYTSHNYRTSGGLDLFYKLIINDLGFELSG
jgi:hypothetical protein